MSTEEDQSVDSKPTGEQGRAVSLEQSGGCDSDPAPLLAVTGGAAPCHRSSPAAAVVTEETPPRAGPEPETLDTSPGSSCCGSHLGLLLALCAAFCTAAVDALVKGLTSVDPAALSAFRFAIMLVPTLCVAGWRRTSVFPRGRRRMLLLRSVLGTAALVTKFYAVRMMPLADASVIVLSAPVFVAVFARVFLKEPFTWVSAVTIVGAVAGIVLIVRPPFLFGGGDESSDSEYSALGPILACSSTIIMSLTYITLRQLKDVHFSTTLTMFCLTAAPLSLAVWLCIGDRSLPTTPVPWLLVVAVGLISFLLQVFLTKACQLELAGPVSVVRTTSIVFAVVWQVVFFDSVPGAYSLVGMTLVVASVLLVAGRKWYLARRSPNKDTNDAS